jgi:acetyl-CoA acetyltransferase
MAKVYIIDYIRTPIGNFAGTLAHVRTDDLAVVVLKELLARNKNIDP